MTDEPIAEVLSIADARKRADSIQEAREVRRLRRIARAKAGNLEKPAHPGGIDDLDLDI